LSKDPSIDKVLFIVDRQDLDYQTMKEYDKFEKGAANATKDTKELEMKLSSIETNDKIAITTIQKLNVFISKNPTHPTYSKKIVLIFDECHRSQFGEFHKHITKYFKNYFIFGFTGTPIFTKNSNKFNAVDLQTTEQAFGQKLHSYTIIDAIQDDNVLPFKVEYVNTMKANKDIEDMKI
jgi:type I restriction enzyme R subunit